MMKKFLYLNIIFLIISCAGTNLVTVTNVHDMSTFDVDSYIYALPRTRLRITVTALKQETVPGPYNRYAEKYLGIVNAPSVSQQSWQMLDIQLNSLSEPDPDYFFSVKSSKNSSILKDNLLKMDGNGLIVSPDATNLFAEFHQDDVDKMEPLHFTDLSVKRNIITEPRKTKQKQGKADIPLDMPVSKSKKNLKTVEEKAEEAANFIIKIRKRRFKLLAGQYDHYPEGEALKTGIEELNKLEDNYLSLFVGKTYTDTVQRTYFYTPGIAGELERNVVCRFSDETGFEDPSGNNGKPLVLELKNVGLTASLEHLQLSVAGPNYSNTLFYRIPDMASARIFFGSLPVLEAELKIYQYGSVVPFNIENRPGDKK